MKAQAIDPYDIALRALAWILSSDERATRFLSLTGLSPETLRTQVGNPETLAAVLGFLESHEPDLVACAEAIGEVPETLVGARAELER